MNKKLKDIDEIAAVCSDCGNCLHACPVYNAEWVEPNSPRGKVNLVKALRDGKLEPNALNTRFVYQCLLCGSCQDICTNGVEFVDMLVEYRNKLSGGKKIPVVKKLILYFYQSFLFKKFTWVVDILARTPLRRKLGIPRRRRANLGRLIAGGKGRTECDILLFPGCVTARFYPEIIEKLYRLLEKRGYSVIIPKGLECCGAPYRTQGWDVKFREFRDRNAAIFSQYRYRYLLVPCGTGVKTFKQHYDLNGVEVYELTEFFHRFLSDEPVKTGEFKSATWHDPCHHLKGLGLGEAPRHFMKQLGDEFIDDDTGLCCGFGGIFSVGFPSTSRKVLKRREERLKELGAETVVTACPGCYLHLRENLDRDVKFFIDLFD